MAVSVIIAEDHDVTRAGLRSLLEAQAQLTVVATTNDGWDAVSLLREHHPDLAVLDLELPGRDGLAILQQLQKWDLPARVIIFSMHGEDSYVSEAFRLGAVGYVLKGAPLSELTEAIRTVLNGKRYLSSDLPERLLRSDDASDDTPLVRHEALTSRELEILQLTAEGYTNREIGDRLSISHRTVDKHRENIQKKLGVRTTVEMATYAQRRELLNDHSPE